MSCHNGDSTAVLIQGQVGIGKTAFMKCCASSWASNGSIPGQAGEEHPLKEMDLVVFIDKTHERKTWEATFKKAVHGNSDVKQQAWAMLQDRKNRFKIAILVDGVNEFKKRPIINAIFDTVKNRTCHMVISCRTYHDVLRNKVRHFNQNVELQGVQYNCLQNCISRYLELYDLTGEQPTVVGDAGQTLFLMVNRLNSTERRFWTVPMNLSFLCQEFVMDRQLNLESNRNLLDRFQEHVLNREHVKLGVEQREAELLISMKRLWKAAYNCKQFNVKVSLERLGTSKESPALALLKKVGYNEYTWPTKSLFKLHANLHEASLWYNRLSRFFVDIFHWIKENTVDRFAEFLRQLWEFVQRWISNHTQGG